MPKNVLAWLALPVALCLVVAGAWLGQGPMKGLQLPSLVGSRSESTNTVIINSIRREQQVVLLSLGIQGIAIRKGRSTFLGVNVPGSERASFVQYTFNAKLGIEGKNVEIRKVGDKEFVVSVPKFVFLGHDNEKFALVAESNGMLSWVTPVTDTVEMINNILSDDAQSQYVASNDEILKDQAELFYTSIVSGIDPDISLQFEFPWG